jgi:hypothetical protein
MEFSFGMCHQFCHVIVARSAAEPHWSRLCSVAFRWRRIQDLIQADPQRRVDDLIEGPMKFGSAFPGLNGYIRIQRQGRSHIEMMTLFQKDVTVNDRDSFTSAENGTNHSLV